METHCEVGLRAESKAKERREGEPRTPVRAFENRSVKASRELRR